MKNVITESYDFTCEVANILKENINNFLQSQENNILKRYLIYRKYSAVLDPDNHSYFLQEVYNKRWPKKYLENCLLTTQNNLMLVYSDTMTSAQTLLNHFYKHVGSSNLEFDWLKYKKQNPKAKYCSDVAMTNILQAINHGSKDYPIFEKYFLDDSSVVCQFIKCYHTIGNYIPVPEFFNTNRSNYGLHDRWDLTLGKINEYYKSHNKEQVIKELLHIKDKKVNNKRIIEKTQKWLNAFKSWHNFIKQNYLQDFVDLTDKDYPLKKAFKDIYNWDDPLPDNFDYLKYFENITEVILKRGKRILKDQKK